MNYLQWIATLLGLVETYVAARTAPGATAEQANVATLNAAASIITHIATPPATGQQ